MDLDSEWDKLSPAYRDSLIEVANRFSLQLISAQRQWSFFSTDMLTDYAVFLSFDDEVVQFGGLPFVLTPREANDSESKIKSVRIVDARIYGIPSESGISNSPPYGQFDFLSVYHAAAILRDFRRNQYQKFNEFREQVCR
jgi:hypothetical protein